MDYIYFLLVLLAIAVMFIYFFQSLFLLFLRYFLQKRFQIDLDVKSYVSKTINVSCPQLGLNIKIEHFGLSSKLFNSKYNSLIALKFSDIRLEGDITASVKCLKKVIKKHERHKPSREDGSVFQRTLSFIIIRKVISIAKRLIWPFFNYLSSNFQISLHNTSLMQLGLSSDSTKLNDCLLHSTIQLIQIAFSTKFNGQLLFQVDGFSIKVLKSSNYAENSDKTCLAQMSFPFLFNYLIEDQSIDMSILDLEIIVYDILQLLNILLPNQRRRLQVESFSKFKVLEQLLQLFPKILQKQLIRDISFRLNSGSIKLVREYGKKELTLGVKPIELHLNKLDSSRLNTRLSIENFRIQDSESIIDFSLNKCSATGKIEMLSEKLYFQLVLEITSTSFVINNSMIHSWFQYFLGLVKNIRTNKHHSSSEASICNGELSELSFHDFIAQHITKFSFQVDINDISLTMRHCEENSMVTYGLKHLHTVCVHNLDVYFKETSIEFVLETFWCWNGNKNLKPANPNSLKKYNEKHVPLFMSNLILKFGNMNSSDLRINCVMDGLQVSAEYFLNQLESVDFDYFKNGLPVKSSPLKSKVSGYNVLAQINFTSVNLFTSQLMVRIDSMAIDLNGRKLSCSINGFAINSMYAPSATLACLKASELTQHRIVYFSVMRINFSQDIKEISLSLTEEIFVQWSPSFHQTVEDLREDFGRICSRMLLLNSNNTDKAASVDSKFSGFNMSLKLDGKISLGILLTNEGDTMRFETEYFVMSFQNMSYISSKCELLSIYFNDVHNVCIEQLLIRYLPESKNPVNRKVFKLMEKEKNNAIEVTIHKVAIVFPYQFNFAYYFNEKFMSIIKWLRLTYSKGKLARYLQAEVPTSLVPDFIVKIHNIYIEVGDDPFEVRLSDNYILMEDEYKESQRRWNIATEKIVENIKKPLSTLPESKMNELKSSFNKQNAQTYTKRSRKLYETSQMRTQLFTVNAEDFTLHLAADTSYNTYEKMVRILRTIDCASPFPDDLKFSTIWCKQIVCNIGKVLVSLRDFPQPMLHAKEINLRGILLGAEQEASARARRTCEIDMGPNFSKIKIERSMTTLKFYHDISSKIGSLVYTHGACWEPILQQVNLSFENIFKPSQDPSPSLTWWDKMRFLFHGNLHVVSDQIAIVFHASLDPYNSTELIEISFVGANIELVTGKIMVSSDLDALVHTASKYDECRIVHLPDINITFMLNWDCSGNRYDHHSVMPCARDKLPEYTCNQVHDSYRAFRSHHLNLSASIETKERHPSSEEPDKIPTILLYNSTLRWLENKMFMITGFPRLTRRGKLYDNVRPRKMPFTRLFKSIRLTIYLQKLEITYWSSYSRNRGFKISSCNLTHSAEHRQTFVKIMDNLIHRPKPMWELIYMNSELSDVEVDLYKLEPNVANEEPARNFFLNLHKVSYNRETKVPHIVSEENEQSPIHRLIVHDLKGAWTKDNRDIVLSLFDSYFKTQLLKRNLSTEALRLFKDQIGGGSGSPTKNQGQSVMEKGGYGQAHLSKGNAANMLQKLIAEVESESNVADTEHIENVVTDRPMLYGIEACQTNDILLNNWLIELINSQVVLRGCETDGYVIVSAAKTQVTQRIHRPVWKNRILYSKTTWQGSLECMQYYATVDAGGLRIDDITWLDLDDIEERNGREIVEIPDLVGSGRSVGGVVNSEAGGSSCSETNKVPIQLQRIVSRCRCQFFYASYGENTDPNNYEEVPPLPQDDLLPLEPWDKEVAVDTFTLTHEHLEISTNSQQFAMIMDLVNNLLLYVPHKKEVFEKQQRIRFSMQLNSLEDQRGPISELQDQVRLLLTKIKALEKENYRVQKNTQANLNELDSKVELREIECELNKCKEELSRVGDDLSIMINCYKEAQLIASKTKERQVAAQESRDFLAQVIRRNEVCFKQASWRLTDADGQLGLADLVLHNFLYTKVSKNDDSVQHSFELGYVRVQNMLPNQAYRDVLQPTELQPNMPVDQHRALRIICIEKAPVGGISVKEHLEVNVIPLTVGLTYAFFKKMLKFFFPERSAEATTAAAATATAAASTTSSIADSAVDMTADDVSVHSSAKEKGSKKKSGGGGGMKKEDSMLSITSSLSSYNFKSNSKNPTSFQHIEKMRERASKNQTFVFIKIPEVPIRISYKGHKNKNLEDLHDVSLVLPTFEYHNRTWTWLDLLMALKTDSKRVLLSQALKHKFHISKSKPLSSETEKNKQPNQSVSAKSSEDEDKVRILLGNIVVPQKAPKTKSILLFGNKK